MNLSDKVAVVTGGTFGVGRGIANVLAESGARVFITGRSAMDDALDGGRITAIRCDHRNDEEVAAAFKRVTGETGGIDILVNNVWGGYECMVEDGVFTWTKPFWGYGSLPLPRFSKDREDNASSRMVGPQQFRIPRVQWACSCGACG